MKRVIIARRWSGSPKSDWYPWLAGELRARGLAVSIPKMGNTDEPTITEWVENLASTVGEPDEETILVAHSIGAQTAMRFLERAERAVGGCVFVAPWFNLENLEDEETERIARPWLDTPIDVEKVRTNAGKVVAFFSDDDPYVPIGDAALFASRLGAETHLLKKRGHFTEDNGANILPEVLNAVTRLSARNSSTT